MKKVLLLSAALMASFWAMSHEFWLLPSTWFAQPGQPVRVQLCVGEGFRCEPWEAGTSRVTQFSSYVEKKSTHHLASLQKHGLDSLWLYFEQPGTHLVALSTNSKLIELAADKFDAYLEEDGLEHIRALRRERGQTDRPGRELYRREAATLIQVGTQPSHVFFDSTSFELRILPEKNPLLSASTDSLGFQIQFKGQPLTNALVRHWHHDAAGEPVVQFKKSDALGRVRFQLNAGPQMVSVVHMLPHSEPKEADWQSIWGNLTFCLR
jgi:uncharacterized GH25 family protein